jgi:NTE family protein
MRRGLVLGAGGVLGYAWSACALRRLEDTTGWDPRTAHVLVGTSAGAALAAQLGSGVRPAPPTRSTSSGGPLPPLPRGRPLAPQLLAEALRGRVPLTAGLAGLLPAGRVERLRLGDLGGGAWPAHPRVWVVAMDTGSGARVAFGREGAPAATIQQAVAASCAIPGWVAPVAIGGRRYLDGGAWSPTSLDLVAGLGLDEVVVISPLTSARFAVPGSVAQVAERALRAVLSRALDREAAQLEAAGTRVVRIEPTAHELRLMGANFMDGRRVAQVVAAWV